MKRWLGVLMVLIPTVVSLPTRAQHGMHIEVQADRIAIGSEFLPRFRDLAQTFAVARGASAVLPAGTYDYIEVGGTLTIPAVQVRVTHLVVLPGGTLAVECGAEIIGRDVPIDTTRDPFQWGNGLVNFGTKRMVCPVKTAFAPIAAAAEGATTLTLASPVEGWADGDELLVVDTRQVTGNAPPRREPGLTIAGLTGTTLTLSKPLGFARDPIRRPDGSEVLLPRVANLTRRTVIRSENPGGVRWHTANIGPSASWDVQGVALVGLGRTRNEKLDSTSLGSHIGTNQVGRYADHDHHNGSSLSVRRSVGNAYLGVGGGKWGKVIHQSHDTEVRNNVCVDAPGGCFITEDGNEVRNVFKGNFAAYVRGNGGEARQNVRDACPGCESAFWFRGVHNVVEGNEAWNSQTGINLFNQQHAASAAYPSERGSTKTTTGPLANMKPLSLADNIAAANTDAGLEYWSVPRFPAERNIAAHNAVKQAYNAQPETTSEMYLIDTILVASGGVSECLKSSQGYTWGVDMLRGELRGCRFGLTDGIAMGYGKFTETVFQNIANVWILQPGGWPKTLTFTRVRHEPLGTRPPDFIHAPLAEIGEAGMWYTASGSVIQIDDWQGTGRDYRLLGPNQVRSTPAIHPTTPEFWFRPPPLCGTTSGETWDRCGIAFGGDTFAPGEETALEGVVNFVGLPDPRPLGPPRAVMTWPNAGQPAVVDNGSVLMVFALTGQEGDADSIAYISVDGGRKQGVSGTWHLPWFRVGTTTATAKGVHTVRTWRERKGAEVPNSALTFQYFVGAEAPPPVTSATVQRR